MDDPNRYYKVPNKKPFSFARLTALYLSLCALASFGLSQNAHAAFIQNTTGLGNATTTLSFSEITPKPADKTALTNQFASYGVNFINMFYNGAGDVGTRYPNLRGDYLSNYVENGISPLNPIRIVFNGGSTTSGSAYNNIDNLAVSATVATFEPSTYAMMFLGVGALGLMTWKRKRREMPDSSNFAESAN